MQDDCLCSWHRCSPGPEESERNLYGQLERLVSIRAREIESTSDEVTSLWTPLLKSQVYFFHHFVWQPPA
jgi:hypothetical protein